MIKSQAMWESNWAASNEINTELTEQNKEQYLNDNKDLIISYLEWLDSDDDNLLEFSDFSDNDNDLLSIGRILRALWMDTIKLQDGINISEVASKIKSFSLEVREVRNESTNQRVELYNEVESSLSLDNRFSNLSELDLFNIRMALNMPVDKNSYDFDRKGVQRALNNMGYDISYTNRNGELVTWEKAIDWDLGSAYTRALKQLQSDLGVAQTWVLDQTTVDSFQSRIQPLVYRAEQNNNSSSESNREVSQENQRDRTIEENDSSLEITFWVGKTDFEWLRENINTQSFESLAKRLSFEELSSLYNSLVSISRKNNLNERTWKFNFSPFNIRELRVELEKYWYEADWVFWWIEMGSILQLVENIYQTQEKFNNWVDFKDRLAVLLDYNGDWFVDNEVRFYTKEKQFLEAIQWESNFENLLKNLWYSSITEFNNSFNNNYYSARAEFKTRLASVLSVDEVLNPGAMLNNPNALREFRDSRENISNIESEVSEVIETHEKTKNLDPVLKSQIKLQAVWAVVWSSTWLWASFDVKEATNSLIDSAWFGIFNWVPWIGIWKNIYRTENGWFRVDAWLVNLIPVLGASWDLTQWEIDEFKSLFPNEFSWDSQISLWAGISTLGWTVWVNFNNLNENTRLWIERAKGQMSEVLDKVFEDIQDWKSFDESNFSSNENDRIVYERLAWMLEANWWHTSYLKEWALNNYERVLYENADWLNFSWIWLWLAFVAWYLPIPLVFAWAEYHNTEWSSVDTYSPITESWNWYVESWIEWNKELLNSLSSFENAFSWKTRYNKGSVDFLTTTNSLEKRWEWLNRLSTWVRALREAKLQDFLSTIDNNNDKWVVISTLSQYMKKANDFDNWNLSSWNDKTSEFIRTDRERRAWFNEMFWFNLDSEAEELYSKLESSDNIWRTQLMWLWFDATASKNVEWTTVKWIDTLYTNLSIMTVDWEPLLIAITDSSKIEAFKQTLNTLSISEELKQSIISWLESWDIELKYYKDPEGFDDRILLTQKWDSLTPQIDVYQPNFNTVNVGLGFAGEKRESDWWSSGSVASTPWVEWEDGPGTGGWTGDAWSQWGWRW